MVQKTKQKVRHACLNCDFEGERMEVIEHCRGNTHGWISDKIDVIIKDGIWKLGTIGVDSGTIMIGDPCYQLPDHAEYEAIQTWDNFCNILSENSHNPTQIGLSIATSTYQGDGEFIVYGKFEGGRPRWVKVDFTARIDKYEEPEVTRKQLDIEATRKAQKGVWKILE